MAASDKDTIYVDIDDEITAIIDKVQASKGKVIALVLPKRAAVFQSIVNMKLLKRAADGSKKNIVLITSEAGLLPLAGAAGLHVAKTLNSKPEIPVSPDIDDGDEVVDEDTAEELPDDEPLDKTASIGALAGGAAVGAAAAADDVETVVLDDEDVPPETEETKPAPKQFKPPKKDKKLSVPDFDRFRLFLILGGSILFLLIVGFAVAAKTLPKANIAIKTDASAIDVNADLNLSTTATKFSSSDNTIPAKVAQQQKTYTQQVATTGQKNNGNKASGSVTMSAGSCSGDVPNGIPSGAGLSSSGQTYITQDSVTFIPTVSKGKCVFQGINSDGHPNIPITAQSGGTSFNVSGVSFSVSSRSDVTASGSASGGTDNIVQSVNQNDINSAKNKIQAASDSDMKKALKSDLAKDNYYAIEATYSSGTPAVTTSANVGEVADNVTITETITYTMFGVHKGDLETVINNGIKDQIDTSQQSVLDDGLSTAVFNVNDQNPTSAKLTMSTTASVGPDLDVASIRQNAKGKKAAAIKSDLETNPDVKSVDVKLSPFWVSTVPNKDSRITVVIAKPTSSAKASNSNDNP